MSKLSSLTVYILPRELCLDDVVQIRGVCIRTDIPIRIALVCYYHWNNCICDIQTFEFYRIIFRISILAMSIMKDLTTSSI